MIKRLLKWSLLIILPASIIFFSLALHHKYGKTETINSKNLSIANSSPLNLLVGAGNLFSQACCEHSQTVFLNDTNTRIIFELRADDALVKKSKRTELRALPEQFNQKVVYEFAVQLNEQLLDLEEHIIIAQWHASKDILLLEKGRFPPLEIALSNGAWKIIQTVGRVPSEIKTKPLNTVRQVIYNAPIIGVNHRFKIEVSWSDSSEGSLRINHNDNEVAKILGPNTYNDFWGPYFKFGLYIPEWNKKDIGQYTSSASIIFSDLQIIEAH